MYVPVVCPVCQTRMFGAIEQVGQEIICPDCGKATVVPPPKAPAKPAAARAAIGEYSLLAEVESAAGGGHVAEEALIRVICPVCGTMMYATEDQVGSGLVCPDCRRETIVPPPPPRRKAGPAGTGEVYGLAGEGGTSPWYAAPPSPATPPAAEKPPAVRRPGLQPHSERPVLPRWPFLSGTFSFPFSAGARAYLVAITVWAIPCFSLARESWALLSATDGRVTFLSAMFLAGTGILGGLWLAFVSACALAVVRDTANGCGAIQSWPDLAFFDWFLEALYLFNGFWVSVLPGMGIAWWLAISGQQGYAVRGASLFFFLPIVLLSMLERGSFMSVISLPVCRTFGTAWRGWASFYLATGILLTAAGNAVLAALSVAEVWGIVAAISLAPIVWLIYFRLLGRLAWYFADRAPCAEPATESDADENLSEDDPATQDADGLLPHGRT